MNINKVIIGGRLVADPELRQTSQGASACRVTVAVDRNPPKNGGETATDFFDISAFDKRAELLARKFRKGSRILIVGRLQQRRWETKSGEKRQSYEVSADEIQFIDPKDPYLTADAPSQTPEKKYAPVTVPSTGKQVGIPIPPSHLPPSYGGAQAGYEEIPGDDQLPF